MQWRKILLCTLIFCAFVGLAAARWHSPIRPGDHVFDAARFAQWVKAYEQFCEQVKNSVQHIENQLADLAPTGTHADIRQETNALAAVKNNAAGLLQTRQTPENLWQTQYAHDFFNIVNDLQEDLHLQAEQLRFLDTTGKDALAAAKLNARLKERAALLRQSLQAVSDATGNLSSRQAAADLLALESVEHMTQNQLYAVLLAHESAEGAASAENYRQNYVSSQRLRLTVVDPYAPAANEQRDYARPQPRGFVHLQ